MRHVYILLGLLCLSNAIFSQYTYTIKADSVKITNCDSSELIIENHTQGVPGFLFNTGNGRTQFRRGVVKINGGLYLIGADTLNLGGNPWVQGGNSFGATGVLGTQDNHHLDLYTNNIQRVRLDSAGNLLIGTTTDNGSKFQVNGTSYFNGTQQITGTANATVNQFSYIKHNPTITGLPGDGNFVYDVLITPNMSLSGNNQVASALCIAPNYILNGYSQSNGTPSAVDVICGGMGGITIDQNIVSFSAGNPGQPLYINQQASADKEAVQLYRNGNPTIKPFIWTNDARTAVNSGSIIPTIRSTINTTSGGVSAGGGISYTLDRFYSPTEASIVMKYELTPISNNDSTIKTAIAFNTTDLSDTMTAALYISGSKIGIGTTTPSAQLNTTGSVRFAGLTSDSTQTRVLVSDGNGNLFYRSASSLASNGILNSNLAGNPTINSSLAVNGEIRHKDSGCLRPAGLIMYLQQDIIFPRWMSSNSTFNRTAICLVCLRPQWWRKKELMWVITRLRC